MKKAPPERGSKWGSKPIEGAPTKRARRHLLNKLRRQREAGAGAARLLRGVGSRIPTNSTRPNPKDNGSFDRLFGAGEQCGRHVEAEPLVVFRLTSSSNFTGARTRLVAGFSPLRMRWT